MRRLLKSLLFGLALPALAATAPAAGAADRALLIGLDSYSDKRLNSKIGKPSAHDVGLVKGLLTSHLQFKPENIKVLADGEATREGILAALRDWLVNGTQPGDRAYIYFAGQGYFTKDLDGDEKDGLDEGFVPFDAKVSLNAGNLAIDGLVTDDDLSKALSELTGRKVSLVADAGFSGRVVRSKGGNVLIARAPDIEQTTRAIVVEAKAQIQKSEGKYLDALPAGVKLGAWTAVSASQTALLEIGGGGIFTRLYVEGITKKLADANGNGKVSNAELLAYITTQSQAYCAQHKGTCQLGLTPRLEPKSAHAGALVPHHVPGKVVVNQNVNVTVNTVPANHVPVKLAVVNKITADTVTDFLSKGNPHGVQIVQLPAQEVYVGDKDIRFKVVSPHDGYLILLNLADDGKLIQLFPNQFSRKRNTDGQIRANAPLTVPDSYYGIRFNATEPSSGRIIAIVARQKVDWSTAVGTRAIEVIPREKAVETVLPKIAAELGSPPATQDPLTNTQPTDWSVATMRYVIKPR